MGSQNNVIEDRGYWPAHFIEGYWV
jgi:hypothetical protein